MSTMPDRRPRGGRHVDALCLEEVAPCGVPGGLSWHYSYGKSQPPDLADVRVMRLKPWRLVLWEPLPTKAPGPHIAQAFCCYINTVIFYHAPYVKSPWRQISEWRGRLEASPSAGHIEEWDRIETRFAWDDLVSFEGEVFEVGGGRVIWSHAAGERRRWWMRRWARGATPARRIAPR